MPKIRRFYVDWEDEAYPQVRDAKYDPDGGEGQTLAMCKAEIAERARNEISHWRTIASDARSLKASDISG